MVSLGHPKQSKKTTQHNLVANFCSNYQDPFSSSLPAKIFILLFWLLFNLDGFSMEILDSITDLQNCNVKRALVGRLLPSESRFASWWSLMYRLSQACICEVFTYVLAGLRTDAIAFMRPRASHARSIRRPKRKLVGEFLSVSQGDEVTLANCFSNVVVTNGIGICRKLVLHTQLCFVYL